MVVYVYLNNTTSYFIVHYSVERIENIWVLYWYDCIWGTSNNVM